MLPEQDLYALIKQAPEKGLEAIMDRYTGLVYAIVWRKLASVGTRQDAEECVSDVFLELWYHREALDPSMGSLKAYLATVAKRQAIDVYRRIAAKRRHFTDEELPTCEPGTDTDPASETAERESADALIRAVHALGRPDSEIIIRKYYFGESAKSIGKALKMKENTVNKRAGRALVRLKEIMGGMPL